MWEIVSRRRPYDDMLPPAIPIAVMQGYCSFLPSFSFSPSLPVLVLPSSFLQRRKRPEIPHGPVLLPGLIPLIQRCWAQLAHDRPDVPELRHSVEILELSADSPNRIVRREADGTTGEGNKIKKTKKKTKKKSVNRCVDSLFDSKASGQTNTSSTVSIVLPKMAAPTGMVSFVYLDVRKKKEMERKMK
jgi:hypothetical protein